MTSPGPRPASSVAHALRRLAVTCARGIAARACRSPLPQATEGARGAGTAAAIITAPRSEGRRRLTTSASGAAGWPRPGEEVLYAR